jgi:putative NADH-flavin reductase
MRIVIFGANGGTGRRLTVQALAAGHHVVAVTRNPGDFPVTGRRLRVEVADVHHRVATRRAVDGADAVLSTLGVPFTRQPVRIYSDGAASIIDAMGATGVKRVVVVSSSGAHPTTHAEGGFLLNRVMQPMVTRTIGRTTYADMRRMEALLAASSLDWTVLRPGGLFDTEHPGTYELAQDRSERVFTSRADLAAAMLEQATTPEWVGKFVAVNTTEGTPTVWQMVRREAFSSS